MGHHLFHTVNRLTSTIKPSIVFLVEQTCWLIKVNNCHPDNFELKFVLKDNFNCDFHIYDQSIYRSGYSVHSFLSFGSVSQRACNSIYKEQSVSSNINIQELKQIDFCVQKRFQVIVHQYINMGKNPDTIFVTKIAQTICFQTTLSQHTRGNICANQYQNFALWNYFTIYV